MNEPFPFNLHEPVHLFIVQILSTLNFESCPVLNRTEEEDEVEEEEEKVQSEGAFGEEARLEEDLMILHMHSIQPQGQHPSRIKDLNPT